MTVTIMGTGYGGQGEIGRVMETLPAAEFTYVEGSATRLSGHPNGVVRGKVDPDNNRMVTFSVVSVESFTYRVMVGDGVQGGQYIFSGDAGDSSVTVGSSAPSPGGATRFFSPEPVSAGTELTVTITGTGYGGQGEIGRVMETLPAAEFTYVEGSATRVSGHPNGVVRGKVDPDNDRMVTFSVVSVESFTYRVMVGDGVPGGQYIFSGDAGDSSVTVGPSDTAPPAPATPTPSGDSSPAPRSSPSPPSNRGPNFPEGGMASRSVAEASASGTNVGEPVAADDPDDDFVAHTLIGTDADSFAIDRKTGQITVGAGTELDYETKDTYSVGVRASDGIRGSS